MTAIMITIIFTIIIIMFLPLQESGGSEESAEVDGPVEDHPLPLLPHTAAVGLAVAVTLALVLTALPLLVAVAVEWWQAIEVIGQLTFLYLLHALHRLIHLYSPLSDH